MYRVLQSLNNNAALVKNERGEQAVVMGLGIAFQKRKGDLLRPEKVETVFSLLNEEAKENFLTLLKDIPLDFITASYSVIHYLVDHYHYPVQEYLYVTLTDHMRCSYQALLKGTYQESHLPDMSSQYPLEYQMAQEALALFRQKLSEEFPQDEVGRIALHLINAKGETLPDTHQEQELGKQIMEKVEEVLQEQGIRRQTSNSNFYDRFMLHLSYFLSNLERGNEQAISLDDLDQSIRKTHPQTYEIGSQIFALIQEVVDQPIPNTERFYLVLHIQRLL